MYQRTIAREAKTLNIQTQDPERMTEDRGREGRREGGRDAISTQGQHKARLDQTAAS